MIGQVKAVLYSTSCIALVCAIAGCASVGDIVGRVYHVSPMGSDRGKGTLDSPLRTISMAAGILQPGDTCFVEPGIYRETVRPAVSGTAERPIRFVAGTSGEVAIFGSESVTDWVRHTGQVFRAKVDWPVDQLFVNGSMMTMASTPTQRGDPYELETFDVTIEGLRVTVRGLSSKTRNEWAGGRIWVLGGAGCVAATARIAAQTNNVLLLADSPPLHRKGKAKAYLEGVPVAMDADWEWYMKHGYVYLKLPPGVTPAALEAEATRRRWAFDLSGMSHVTVSGFRVLAAGVNMADAEHCVIDRCRFRWLGFRRDIRGGFNRDTKIDIRSEGLGIAIGGRHNTIRNSVVAYSVGDGVSVWGASNSVENCVVHDCDLSASDCAPVTATGIGHKITRCTIYNAGRSGLLNRHLKAGRIEHNHIHHVGLMTSDLGGTYTYWTDGGGTIIAYNRIHDVWCPGYGGSGIYIDNGSSNFDVHHNLCYNNQLSGIHVNTPVRSTRVHSNTCVGGEFGMVMGGGSRTVKKGDMLVMNNIFTSKIRVKDGVEVDDNFQGPAPGFVDAAKFDFRLKEGSPCVRAGKARDRGCFEFGAEAWSAGSTIPEKFWDDGGW